MKHLAAAGLIACLPAFAGASTFDPFTDFIVFGDSYSDGGAAFALTGGTAPSPAFFPDNQFTNGDVWAVQLGATFANGTNFAVGGAEATAEPGDVSPPLDAQVTSFLTSGRTLGSNVLAAIQIGNNDFGEATNALEAALIGADVIGAIVSATTTLLSNGVSQVAVFGLPDLGKFPSAIASGRDTLATAAVPFFNAALITTLDALFTPEQYAYFDTFGVFETILGDPGAFGITDTMTPCLADPTACLSGDPNTFFFYDDVHATEVVHTEIARAFSAQFFTPHVIPLPTSAPLLATGLGVVLLVRRRRKSPAMRAAANG